MSFVEALRTFADESEPWFRTTLQRLVEQKTISPGKTSDEPILAGAREAVAVMEASGAQAELVDTAGTPSVLARFGHDEPKARVVVYNHLDVQPADAANWQQADPFAFEVAPDADRGFVYRGRGTTDDKGPALCALRAAELAAQRGLPIEIQLLWETEEEIGSPNFGDVLAARKDRLTCDAIIVSDTIWPSAARPAISVGLRGGMQAVLSLRVGAKDTHSGLVGGVARNPLRELAALITAIRGASFWHDDVRAVSDAERESFAAAGFDPAYFKAAHDLTLLETEDPLEMMLRLWTQPTFEVHGITGGYQGDGIKSIVPPQAEAKVSFRLVPDQSAETLRTKLSAFVAEHAPDVGVTFHGAFSPYLSKASGPVHDAIAQALEHSFGAPPVLVREGGSIGAVPMMETHLGTPVHFLPLSLPEHGYHAPNERFDWKQARGGIEAFGRVFESLAR
jgi:acetylornithine deacetylase/succinyl-diaminopimelate desuccinylase-like protein